MWFHKWMETERVGGSYFFYTQESQYLREGFYHSSNGRWCSFEKTQISVGRPACRAAERPLSEKPRLFLVFQHGKLHDSIVCTPELQKVLVQRIPLGKRPTIPKLFGKE